MTDKNKMGSRGTGQNPQNGFLLDSIQLLRAQVAALEAAIHACPRCACPCHEYLPHGQTILGNADLEAENARLRARVQALEDVMAENSPGRRIRELEGDLAAMTSSCEVQQIALERLRAALQTAERTIKGQQAANRSFEEAFTAGAERQADLKAKLQITEKEREEAESAVSRYEDTVQELERELSTLLAAHDDAALANSNLHSKLNQLIAQMRPYGNSPHLPHGQVAEWVDVLSSLWKDN